MGFFPLNVNLRERLTLIESLLILFTADIIRRFLFQQPAVFISVRGTTAMHVNMVYDGLTIASFVHMY